MSRWSEYCRTVYWSGELFGTTPKTRPPARRVMANACSEGESGVLDAGPYGWTTAVSLTPANPLHVPLPLTATMSTLYPPTVLDPSVEPAEFLSDRSKS